MSTTHVVAAGTGESGLVTIINNLTGTGQLIGGAVAMLSLVGVGIMMLFGAFGQQGSLRKHAGTVGVVAAACILLGGAVAVAPMLVDVGKTATSNTNTQQQGAN